MIPEDWSNEASDVRVSGKLLQLRHNFGDVANGKDSATVADGLVAVMFLQCSFDGDSKLVNQFG